MNEYESEKDELEKLSAKLTFLEKRVNDRMKYDENTSHTSSIEESIRKNIYK